jgi:hypothetical protein
MAINNKKEKLFEKYPALEKVASNDVMINMTINGYVNGFGDEATCINRIIKRLGGNINNPHQY